MPNNTETRVEYYLLLSDGEEEGPYSISELREMLQRDLISADTEIRQAGKKESIHLDDLLHGNYRGALDDITGLKGLGGFEKRPFGGSIPPAQQGGSSGSFLLRHRRHNTSVTCGQQRLAQPLDFCPDASGLPVALFRV